MVFGAVTFIKSLEAITRIVSALITGSDESFTQHFAPVSHMKAILAAGQTSLAINPFYEPHRMPNDFCSLRIS